MTPGSLYCLDTSGFLDGFVRQYPPEVFAGLWDRMDALARQGRLLVPEEVMLELEYHADDAYQWLDDRSDAILVPTDGPIVSEVRSILGQFPRLAMSGSTRNRADPFVIATASVRNAVVITGERGGSESSPKIPFVCDGTGVDRDTFLGLVRRESWTFG